MVLCDAERGGVLVCREVGPWSYELVEVAESGEERVRVPVTGYGLRESKIGFMALYGRRR